MSIKPPTGRGVVWSPFHRRLVNERSVDLRETRRLYEEVTAQWRASMWSGPHIIEALTMHAFNKLDEWLPVPEKFHEPVRGMIRALLEEEDLLLSSANGDNLDDMSLKEQVALRQYLRAQRDLLRDEEATAKFLIATLMSAMGAVTTALPRTQQGIPLFQVPVADMMTVPLPTVIERIMAMFLNDEVHTSGLFAKLREQFYFNLCNVAGIEPYQDQNPKLIPATKAKIPPQDLVPTYLGGTPYTRIFEERAPFHIGRERFNEHGFIFGRSGHGKTQALRSFVATFIQEQDPPALFLIDSLGALIRGIDELEVFDTKLRDRLVILDPTRPQYMPRLNFFGLQSDELVFYLFKSIDQSFTTRQGTMISYLMEYMRHTTRPTLLQLIELCQSKKPPDPQLIDRLSPYAQLFFKTEFYGKGDTIVQQTKSQIAQRLFTLARLPKFEQIFEPGHKTFDAFACMQQKKIVLINTDARSPARGGLGEGSSILGRLILSQCLEAARERPYDRRELALLIVDEAKAYMDDQAALILSDARQYGMGMLLASQQPHQLPEGVRRELNTNTSIRMMGNVEYSVASQYSRDMFCEPEFILRMKKHDRSHAEWALYVSGMDHALKVDVPYGALERMTKRKQKYGSSLLRADVDFEAERDPEPGAGSQNMRTGSVRKKTSCMRR